MRDFLGGMKRREFITIVGGTAAMWPLAANPQQGEPMRRVGVLMDLAENDQEGQARIGAFLQDMQQSGWTNGRNVEIDIRWGAGDPERIRKHAVELVALPSDIVLASTSVSVDALQLVTSTVPVVFVQVVDPVVESLSRPGRNTTGFSNFKHGMSGKWLELLKEIIPRMTRVAVIRDPAISAGPAQFGPIQAVAPSFGVELQPISVRDVSKIEDALTAFARSANAGLIVTGSPLAVVNRLLIIELAYPQFTRSVALLPMAL